MAEAPSDGKESTRVISLVSTHYHGQLPDLPLYDDKCHFWSTTTNVIFGPGLGLPGQRPGRVAQSVGHLIRELGVLGSIPGVATYFRFSFRFLK